MNLLANKIDFTDPVVIAICCAAIALIIVVLIITVVCVKSRKKKTVGKEQRYDSPAVENDKKAEEPAKNEPTIIYEDDEPEPEPEKTETPARQTIKVTVKPKEEKPVKKQTVKITEKPKAEATVTPEAAVKPAEPKKDDSVRIYHIAKRRDDGKWQVKAEGAEKALKLFDTQAEAIDYAKALVANNPDAQIRVHKVDGSFRKTSY